MVGIAVRWAHLPLRAEVTESRARIRRRDGRAEHEPKKNGGPRASKEGGVKSVTRVSLSVRAILTCFFGD